MKYMLCLLLFVGTVLTCSLWYLGFRYDATGSLNHPFYLRSDRVTYKSGDIILFCPTESQNATATYKNRQWAFLALCKNRIFPYLKRVVQVGGQRIRIDNNQLFIDQQSIGKPLPKDWQSRPIPVVVNADLVYVEGDHPYSNDSRLYGGINPAQIVSVMKPVF